jgi:hypothetical protein
LFTEEVFAEQVIPHEELLEAVHEATVQYVEAERALKNYRLALNHLTPESHGRLEELQRTASARSQALRAAQVQLLLSKPSY